MDSASTIFVAENRAAPKKSAWTRRKAEVLTPNWMVAAAAATAAEKTGTEAVEEGGGARGREKEVGGGTRRRRSERGGRRRRQGTTERAESDAAVRDEGERTCHHIATSTEHLTISSANP